MATSFVLLGMPMAAIGVAWPSAADDLGRPLADLGLITFAYGAGYTVSTLANGELTRRFTAGPLLVGAALASSLSLAAFALSSTWLLFLGAGFMLGLAGGVLDSGVNAYVAVHRGARAMGIVHTGFGIGSTLGPLFVTVLLALGVSWRVAFGSLAVADLLLAVAFLATISAIEGNVGRTDRRPSVGGNRLVLGLSVTVFFLYAGVAAGTGAWTFSLFTEGRGISDGVAGMAVAGYWAGMTVARIALGVFGDRVDPNRVLTASGFATVASLVLVWLAPTPWLGILGLVASGVGTRGRLPARDSPNAEAFRRCLHAVGRRLRDRRSERRRCVALRCDRDACRALRDRDRGAGPRALRGSVLGCDRTLRIRSALAASVVGAATSVIRPRRPGGTGQPAPAHSLGGGTSESR